MITGMEVVKPRTDPAVEVFIIEKKTTYLTALYQKYLGTQSLKSLKLNWILRCRHQRITATLQVPFPAKGVPYLKRIPFCFTL